MKAEGTSREGLADFRILVLFPFLRLGSFVGDPVVFQRWCLFGSSAYDDVEINVCS